METTQPIVILPSPAITTCKRDRYERILPIFPPLPGIIAA